MQKAHAVNFLRQPILSALLLAAGYGCLLVLAASFLPWFLVLPLVLLGAAGLAYGQPKVATEADTPLPLLFEQIPLGVYVLEKQRLLYVNPAFCQLYRLPAEHLLKCNVADLVHPDDHDRVLDLMQRREAGEDVETRYRFRYLSPNGDVRHFEVHSRRADLNGRSVSMGAAYDVTEQVAAEAEQALAAKVFESTRDGILVLDGMGKLAAVNQHYLDASGLSREELMHKPFSWHANAMGDERFAQMLVALSQHDYWRDEFMIKRADGKRMPIALTATVSRDAEGKVAYYIGVFADLSERRQAEERLAISEKRFQALVEQSLAGIYVVQAGRLVYANPKLAEMSGYTQQQLIGKTMEELTAPEDLPLLLEHHRRRLSGEVESVRYTYRARRADGRTFEVEAQGRVFQYEGRPAVIGTLIDVSDRLAAERQQRLAAKVFDNASEGILITDAQAVIVAVNRAFSRITGYSAEDAIGKISRMFNADGQRKGFNPEMLEALQRYGHWQGELLDRRKDGVVYPVWLSISAVRDEQGRIDSYVGVFTDYSSRKEAEARLTHLANHDSLTGLMNRAALLESLEHSVAHARNLDSQLAVMFIDLDRFKAINDTLGHDAGDHLLIAAAERLKHCLKQKDSIARLGGDEFTVVLEDLRDPNQAADVAERIIHAMARPFHIDEQEMFITASVGVAFFPADGDNAASLLKHADAAMYSAKEKGKNTFQFFSKDMNSQTFEHLLLENSLRRALERQEFELYYQPQIAGRGGEIIGVEALIRWRHPELGLVSPAKFIPLAEQTGLIVAIGDWVLHEACRQMKAWLDAGHKLQHMAVNLSARQFESDKLIDTVQHALSSSGLAGCYLELELTESTVMRDPEAAVAIFDRFRELGVALAIDDFGTGYSSLASLKRFPLDRLKVDRSFVEGVPHDANNMAITEAIIAMAHKLGLKVVAEGVESVAQLDFLRGIGCELAQGFLLSKPLTASDLEKHLQADDLFTPEQGTAGS